MKTKWNVFTLLGIVAATLLWGCSDDGNEPENALQPSDYANTGNWARIGTSGGKAVDVFYVYPTTWEKQNVDDPDCCAIDYQPMRTRVEDMIAEQASAFETVGNLYAPYYRQMAIDVMPTDRKETTLHGEPLTDVTAAFDYFINHYNNGRPYIIAAHSQGSNIMMLMLADYMKQHPEIQQRMIAAYIIGYDVTQAYLDKNKHLTFAQSATDTGVLISWNTEAPEIGGPNPVMADGTGVCINPLSWTRTAEPADVSLNLGCVSLVNGKLESTIPGFADAIINLTRGTVTCSTVNPADYQLPGGLFPSGVYHGQDYGFYYYNIRQNAQDRVNAYLKK